VFCPERAEREFGWSHSPWVAPLLRSAAGSSPVRSIAKNRST